MNRALHIALLFASGCSAIESTGADLGGSLADHLVCPTGLVDCGHVVMCAQPASNPLGHVETCVEDGYPIADVEAVLGPCEPTPRHQGLCRWHCDGGPGCNAYGKPACWGCE